MTNRPDDAWRAALAIIKTLRAAGHQALLAGGCVRDRLLGQTPSDYDVATDAPPPRVGELFPRARLVGAQFGVMLVRRGGVDVEVATFRTDGPYSDGRHPDAVRFGTEEEDARRRDFTINGLFYDPIENRVIDHVGGETDLRARIIRTIGDPFQRFTEDHLRMLRAVRFSAHLDFPLAPDTLEAIRRCAASLTTISPERIWMELEKILTAASRAHGWFLLIETGLRAYLAAPWRLDPREDTTVQKRFEALGPQPIDGALALAAALADRPAESVAQIGQALRLSNDLIDTTVWLVRSLARVRDPDALELADLKLLMADRSWPLLLDLLRADLSAKQMNFSIHEQLLRRSSAIAAEDVNPPPLITGDDLLALGYTAGRQLGAILTEIRRGQLNETLRSRDEALMLARRRLSDH